jgi:serine/threonine-protein kinase
MMAADDELHTRARARLGTTLRGKYKLERVLGVGGMATVFAATHRNGRSVAIKLLHSELSLGNVRARFLREGHAANAVEHPGAVAVLDDDVSEDGAAFLVMELLRGESVEDAWERSARKLSFAKVLAIGYELLDVLEAAHRAGIVHRDIKPANLFLARKEDGTRALKVLDFGIARLADVAGPSATQTGLMMGTPAFMAPEQALGRTTAIGPRTDIWAVGATLFTLVSSQYVHEGENPQELMVRAATVPARKLTSVLPEAPAALAEVVDRALAFNADDRWPNAAAMRDALRAAHQATAPSVAALPSRPSLPSTCEISQPILPPTPSQANLTTANPVALRTGAPTGGDVQLLPAWRHPSVLAIAAGALIATIAVVVVAVTSHSRAPSAAAASAARVETQSTTPAPPAPSLTIPAMDVMDLPVVPIASASASATATQRASTTPTATTSTPSQNVKPGCSPPYVFDSKGVKRWKAGCL